MLKVIDHCESLEYGVWVSLSENSFKDYSENYGNSDHEGKYFGWLSNDIPEYDVLANIPTTVCTRPNCLRPEIIPHEDFEHPLVHDYYRGISKAAAEKRIHAMLDVVTTRKNESKKTKAWWKFW